MSAKYKIRDQHGLNYLTCTVCGWIDLFNRAEYRDILLENLKFCRDNKGLQIWAYVIMSNHIHLIVSTKKPYKLEAVMRDFKSYSARRIIDLLLDPNFPESRREWLLHMFRYFARQNHGKTQEHQIWQSDNHPIELFSEKVTLQKLQYIHNNPFRAKMVRNPEDWVYSSASNYATGEGVFETDLLWTGFSEDGWFYGDTGLVGI